MVYIVIIGNKFAVKAENMGLSETPVILHLLYTYIKG